MEYVVRVIRGARWRVLVPLAIAAVAVVFAVVMLGSEVHSHLETMEAWLASLGWVGPIVFVALFVVLTSMFVPDSLMSIAGGALFGLALGLGAVLVGGLVACSLQYALAHGVLRRRVRDLVDARPRLAMIERAVRRQEVKLQFLIRLTPMNPTLASYLLGATGVRFSGFLVALLGLVPAYTVQVYIGVAGTHVAGMAGRSREAAMAHDGMLLVGLAVCVAALYLITRTATRAIERAAAEGAAPSPAGP